MQLIIEFRGKKRDFSVLQVSYFILHLALSLDEIDILHFQGGKQRDSALFLMNNLLCVYSLSLFPSSWCSGLIPMGPISVYGSLEKHGANETRTQTRIIKNTIINLHKIGEIRWRLRMDPFKRRHKSRRRRNKKNKHFFFSFHYDNHFSRDS